MYCGRCGKPNREGAIYCQHCGAKIIIPKQKEKSGAAKFVIIGIILILTIILTTIGIIAAINSDNVYFSDDDYDRVATRDKKKGFDYDDDDDDNSGVNPSGGFSNSGNSGSSGTRKTKTDIVVDHYYYVDLPNAKAADDLIVKDSVEQKGNTADEIKKIENEIINNYKVKAVNLGEMDVDTARGIANAFKYIISLVQEICYQTLVLVICLCHKVKYLHISNQRNLHQLSLQHLDIQNQLRH